MSHELVIGIAIAVGIAVIFGVKVIAQRILTFKMDESAIVNFIAASSKEHGSLGTEAISAGTGISTDRVADVCYKSKIIQSSSANNGSWCTR